jgi:hypothetical protein
VPVAKSKSNLATAFFHASYGATGIEKEAGILRGVKIMEVGHVANFKGEDGSRKSVKITPAHIDALLAHAGNRALPIHETHEWFDAEGESNADSVERSARIGSLKSFRRDASGHLIADAVLNLDKQPARDLLFGAEHNPEDNCFSAVFSYRKDDPQCMPINFRAADVVPSGAATTALFSEDTTNTTMDDQEFLQKLEAALASPTIHAAITAMVKATKPQKEDSVPDPTPDPEKDESDQSPALMAQFKKLLADERVAILADADLASKASVTALLGKGGAGFKPSGEGDPNATATAKFTAAVRELTDKGVKPGAANLAVMKSHEPLYKQMQVERGIFKAA